VSRTVPFSNELARKLVELRTTSLLSDAEVCVVVGVPAADVRSWIKRGVMPGAPEAVAEFSRGWEAARLARKTGLLELVAADAEPIGPLEPRGNAKSAQWLIERAEHGTPPVHINPSELREESLRERNAIDSLLDDPPDELLEAFGRNLRRLTEIVKQLEAESVKEQPAGGHR
jgi:hypothetical protein